LVDVAIVPLIAEARRRSSVVYDRLRLQLYVRGRLLIGFLLVLLSGQFCRFLPWRPSLNPFLSDLRTSEKKQQTHLPWLGKSGFRGEAELPRIWPALLTRQWAVGGLRKD